MTQQMKKTKTNKQKTQTEFTFVLPQFAQMVTTEVTANSGVDTAKTAARATG